MILPFFNSENAYLFKKPDIRAIRAQNIEFYSLTRMNPKFLIYPICIYLYCFF